jgi:hypothetical protein
MADSLFFKTDQMQLYKLINIEFRLLFIRISAEKYRKQKFEKVFYLTECTATTLLRY